MAMVAASKFAGKRAAGRRGDASPPGQLAVLAPAAAGWVGKHPAEMTERELQGIADHQLPAEGYDQSPREIQPVMAWTSYPLRQHPIPSSEIIPLIPHIPLIVSPSHPSHRLIPLIPLNLSPSHPSHRRPISSLVSSRPLTLSSPPRHPR